MATVGGVFPAPKKPMNNQVRAAIISGVVSIIVAIIAVFGTIFSAGGKITEIGQQATTLQTQIGKITVPPGTVIAYAGLIDADKIQMLKTNGWLLCDGSLVSKETYKDLYQTIGDYWGQGDRLGKFSLPNLQGLFLRGVDATGTNDPDFKSRVDWRGQPGPVVGSFQSDEFRKHSHDIPRYIYDHGSPNRIKNGEDEGFEWDGRGPPTGDKGGSETRPKNAYVYYIIKF